MGLHDEVLLKPPPASGEPEAYCDRVLQRFERLLFFFAPLRILSVMKV
jgi:hypothetical protein